MTRPFRFAVQAMELSDADVIAERARRIEELGYHELYSYDHIGAVDPFIPLMVAAGATTTLRVGPLVINNELHHPALLARTAATVDRLTDIFQFTGLTHGADGTPEPGGFAIEAVAERAQWLSEAAGERDDEIERSVLVQSLHVGDGAEAAAAEAAAHLGLDRALVDTTPFLLFGSVPQIIDELESRRENLGISHVVVRDPETFAPVVAALAGR